MTADTIVKTFYLFISSLIAEYNKLVFGLTSLPIFPLIRQVTPLYNLNTNNMKKNEILNNLRIDKLGSDTVFITNKWFNFSYTIADKIVKDEFKGQYRYFGGLQSEYDKDSVNYKALEKWLCEIAEKVLSI